MSSPDTAVDRIIDDLGEHFADLDDQEDAVFGEFARVTADGNVLTVLHGDEPWGVEITVKRITEPGAEGTSRKVDDEHS